MKNIYMPSMDELYQMQDRGANVYKYILVKAIESIICYGIDRPAAGMLKSSYKYISEDLEIARAICTLYPNEIQFSDVAKEDIELCLRLIGTDPKVNNCNLDYLSRFGYTVQNNTLVLKQAILLLEKELKENPKYRFEYNGDSLLNDIFSATFSEDKLLGLFGSNRDDVVRALVNIEPVYAIKLPIEYFNNKMYNSNEYIRCEYLHSGIANYADRYGVTASVGSEYIGKDILTNPDQNVKRLIKCIKDRNK